MVLQAKAEPAAMDELHRTLSLADEVVRHKVLRIPEQVYGKLAGTPAAETPLTATPTTTTTDGRGRPVGRPVETTNRRPGNG